MDINRKIGQLFTVGFSGKKITENLRKLIHDYSIGGIILFRENVGTPQELFQLIQDLQNEARAAGYQYPLLIGIDEENGTVKRLGNRSDGYPGAMSLSATGNSQNAFDIGQATGEDLRKFGINWNFAPVLDVNNNPDNPVIGVRSFGETPEQVMDFGINLMKGLQSSGTATALKHFPGHGDTNEDTHHALPEIRHDLSRLNRIELKPFKKAILEGADSIMTAHILFPAIEPEKDKPATLSKNVITGLLRDELNFDGVVVTDALEMDAIAETIGIPNAAVTALKAGVDNLLIGHLPEEQIKAIIKVRKAVELGEISKERIEESFNRMTRLKEKYTSWSEIANRKNSKIDDFYNKEYSDLAERIYQESVTVVREGEAIKKDSSVLVLQPKDVSTTVAEGIESENRLLAEQVEKYIPNTDIQIVGTHLDETEKTNLVNKMEKVDHVILGTITVSDTDNLIEFINEVDLGKKLNVIAMKNPYIGGQFKDINYWINTYEANKYPIDLAVRTLLGDVKPSGNSPVTLDV